MAIRIAFYLACSWVLVSCQGQAIQPDTEEWLFEARAERVAAAKATLALQTPDSRVVDFRYGRAPDLSDAVLSDAVVTSEKSDFTARIRVRGLVPDTIYYYSPRVDGRDVFHADYPSFLTAPSPIQPAAGQWLHGPLVGGVTASSATLWLRTPAASVVDFRYGEKQDLSDSILSDAVATELESDFTAHVPLQGLAADTTYYYSPRVDGRDIFLTDFPSFSTAPKVGEETAFTFVIVSDFQVPNKKIAPKTFASAAAAEPVFAIIGGDFDHRDPGKNAVNGLDALRLTRRMHRENYDWRKSSRRELAEQLLRRMGMSHVWDDHDYCCNDSDGTYAFKHKALQAYDEYFPSHVRPLPEEGIYHTWTWGQVQFFLLDGRYHRTPSRSRDSEAKTMLGRTQLEWFQRELLASRAVWKIIISGSVFNPTVKCRADNWCQYRTEGRAITDYINENDIKNIVIISGDIHAGAITNGKNSVYDTFWEMAVPGADVVSPGCDTTTIQPLDRPPRFGEWTGGTWGEGFRIMNPPRTCWGFGQIDVMTNPHRLRLAVKDELGNTMIETLINAENQ